MYDNQERSCHPEQARVSGRSEGPAFQGVGTGQDESLIAVSNLTEKRIAQLTLLLGTIAALATGFFLSVRIGAGIFIGAILAWISFRWLESALDGLVAVSTAKADSPEARVPMSSILRIIGRYGLIAAVVCVTFFVFHIPILSMLLGLCALGAATLLATLYEVLHPAG
jgi:hypothetical protein